MERVREMTKMDYDKYIRLILLNIARYYPKILSIVKFKPNSIEIALTNRCCCKCIMCNYWKLGSNDELTTQEVKDILNQAKELGCKNCTLYGGEPMLRKDIFELVRYANELGYHVGMDSNGYLIDANAAKKLAESGLESIAISIDAVGEIHDELRGLKGCFDNAITAIQELRKNNVTVVVHSLLMSKTLENENILKLIKFMENLGFPVFIQLLTYSPFYFKNNPSEEDLWITERDQKELEILVDKLIEIKKRNPKLLVNSVPSLEYIRKYFRDPKREDIPCYLMYMGRLWVDYQGKLYLCQSLPPIGDLRRNKIVDIISSDNFANKLKRAFMKQCPGCSCGYSTNVHSHISPVMVKYLVMSKLFGVRK